MSDSTTVFVVDDEVSVRSAVERLVTSIGLRCETFGSAEDYLRNARQDVPGCLVLDMRMPGSSGLDLQQKLATTGSHRPIIFLTGHGDIPLSVKAMRAGAVEFLTKPFRPDDLLQAIHQAIDHDGVERARHSEQMRVMQRYQTLTPRERQVMASVVAGLPNKETAQKLDISARTVKAHRAEVMRKMQADSVADLVRMTANLTVAES